MDSSPILDLWSSRPYFAFLFLLFPLFFFFFLLDFLDFSFLIFFACFSFLFRVSCNSMGSWQLPGRVWPSPVCWYRRSFSASLSSALSPSGRPAGRSCPWLVEISRTCLEHPSWQESSRTVFLQKREPSKPPPMVEFCHAGSNKL